MSLVRIKRNQTPQSETEITKRNKTPLRDSSRMNPDPGPENGTRNGTRPPGTETDPTIECLLLAVAHPWSIRETVDRQADLMENFF